MAKEPISITSNHEKVFEILNKIGQKAKNLKPVMRRITGVMLADIEKNFETEGANAGDPWQDWNEKYAQWRKKKGRGSGKILSLEGDLRKSFVREATNDQATVGTNKVYAAIHNFGGEVKTRDGGSFEMTARPFAVWTDNLQELVLEEVTDYFGKM